MKRHLPLLFCSLLLSAAPFALADARVKDAQVELKKQGFYYGDLDGKKGDELAAAIRRFQIRNGLEVTGELTTETLTALNGGTGPAETLAEKNPPPPAVIPKAERQAEASEDTSHLYGDVYTPPTEAAASHTRAPHEPSTTMAPDPSDLYLPIFSRTPYEIAPVRVQRDVVRQAQRELARRGYYRDRIDGRPGEAIEEAIFLYQRANGMRLTGRLDLSVLVSLDLLPGGAGAPPIRTLDSSNSAPRRVYRGIQVD